MTKTNDDDAPARVILFLEGMTWVAQCLDVDIQAQGPDVDTTCRRLAAAIGSEAQHASRNADLASRKTEQVPAYFEQLFERVDTRLFTRCGLELRIAA